MNQILLIIQPLVFFFLISSCESPNEPVNLISLSLESEKNFAKPGDNVKLFCDAEDPDNDEITYVWDSPGGKFLVANDTAIWVAPDSVGSYHISCLVTDGNGTSDGSFTKIYVVKGGRLVEGFVKNAVSGLVESEIKISLNGLTALSNSEGFYSIYVPNFLNSTTISGNGDQFCLFTAVMTFPENYTSNVFEYNFSMSPVTDQGEIRIILTWGASPTDMDSHLLTPEIDSVNFHIYHSNKGESTTAPFVVLDLDDIDGFGPETISIKKLENGIYTYYVHQYSSDGFLNESKGQVQIYEGPSCSGKTINIPTEGDGIYWEVFKINGESGEILEINEITGTLPGY